MNWATDQLNRGHRRPARALAPLEAPAITDVTVQWSFVAENAVPCHAGSQQRLMWSSHGDVQNVHAQLYKGNVYVTSLFRNVPNTGSGIVTVPHDMRATDST